MSGAINTDGENMAPKAPTENDSKDKSTTQTAVVEEIAEEDLRGITGSTKLICLSMK